MLRLSLSVVIPALNAAATLPRCLDRLSSVDEVVVVDGGSTDDTVHIASQAGASIVMAPRGRGVQLRSGGEAARCDWLLFLHADTVLEAGWRDRVDEHLQAAPQSAACFRFRLDDFAWQARLIERGVALRVGWFGLPYGDQGLLVSRAFYDRVGGYRSLPLMEDVDLARRLGPIRVLGADAVTSAERWRRDGWFRRSARNLLYLGLYRAGVSAHQLAKLYGRP